MHNKACPSELDDLPDHELRTRLRLDNFNDPAFVSNEVVCSMFKRAREAGLRPRYLLLSEILSERILARSRRAVLRMGIYPSLMVAGRARSPRERHSFCQEYLRHLSARPQQRRARIC